MLNRTPTVVATAPLREFITDLKELMASGTAQEELVQSVKERLVDLLRKPGWLPEACRLSDPDSYARHLLYRQERGGFCLVTMVWGPGQKTAIHDHAGVWCVEGVYEGQIDVTRFDLLSDEGARVRFAPGPVIRAGVGACGALIPPVEYHRISHVGEGTAISLHVYGKDLEVCHIYRPRRGDLYDRQTKHMKYNSIIPLQLEPAPG